MAKLLNLARMTTATTGTGTITLGSAVAGFLSFAGSGIADGETISYGITDGSNSEIGRGVYTASGTTLTRSVLKSTNSNNAIALSGSAQVFITALAEDFRERLESARTYYVRTNGSDSNTGLANTAGGAFLTIQKAIDVVAGLDLNIYNVTISVADGTYTGAVSVTGPWIGSGTVTLQGNTTTPANCIISTTSAGALTLRGGAKLDIKGFKLQTTTAGSCIDVSESSVLNIRGLMEYGACASAHMIASAQGMIYFWSNYTISGSAAFHYVANIGGVISGYGYTITVSGTPAFSSYFLYNTSLGICYIPLNTYSGAATGARYYIETNAVCYTAAGGASYLPGNTGGSTATGGQYV